MAIVKAPLKSERRRELHRWFVCGFLLFLPLGLSEEADAGGGRWIDVTVTSLFVCSKSCSPRQVVVGLSAVAGGRPPPCSSMFRESVALDVSTAEGAFAAQLFQHSAAAGTKLMVYGTGTCDPNSPVETLSSVSELITSTHSGQSP